jgi:hypothetical protein
MKRGSIPHTHEDLIPGHAYFFALTHHCVCMQEELIRGAETSYFRQMTVQGRRTLPE